ncbi:MbnH family di-heme enzyme [Leptothrix ochracea]|uniref:MbnH family di-heme enzyme n=1 Tax=Leptothrix ochracea TaxID=735331 RepID=UPI0034E1A4B1
MNRADLKLLGVGAAVLAALAALAVTVVIWRSHAPAPAPTGTAWVWKLPKGFPEPFVPADNPMSEAKFQLGRHLFYDKRLSGNGTMACASCHLQRLAFTDGKALATGSTGDLTARSAMSIANVAYNPTLTWANPSQSSLEIQAVVPMFVENLAVELGINEQNKTEVLARFQKNPDDRLRFKAVFPDEAEPISFMNIVKAISAFERGVISGDSKFDRAQAGEGSLSNAEERGRQLFYSEQAQCSTCHSGFNFSDQTMHAQSTRVEKPFHNTGLYNVDGQGAYPADNPGLIGVMPQPASNMGQFRVPSLRNIAVTAPYMHDGSIATLEDVLAVYAAHGRNISSGPLKGDGRKNPFKDTRLDKIQLSAQDRADIVAFLKTLTDESFLTNPRYADPFAPESH